MNRAHARGSNQRISRALLVAFMLSVFANTAHTEGTPTADVVRYAGSWTRTAQAETDAARVVAIEQATRAMPFWSRGLARTLMRSSTRPTERYTLRFSGTRVWITNDDRAPRLFFIAEPGAAEVAGAKPLRVVDGGLERRWRHGENSHGTTLWQLADADRLTVTVTAFDARLSRPDGAPVAILYVTNYSRVREASSSARPE